MFILTSLLQLQCHRVMLTWGIYFPRDGPDLQSIDPHFPDTWVAIQHSRMSWEWKNVTNNLQAWKLSSSQPPYVSSQNKQLNLIFCWAPQISLGYRNNRVSSHMNDRSNRIKNHLFPMQTRLLLKFLDSKTENETATHRTCLSLSSFWKRAKEIRNEPRARAADTCP